MPADNGKIMDNPTPQKALSMLAGLEALDQFIPFLEACGMGNANMAEALRQLPALREQARILYLPDRFNAHFAEKGWIAYDSFNIDMMREAVELADAGQFEEAESRLVGYYTDDTLHWSLFRMRGVEAFRPREDLVKLVKDDYLAGRYHACVPVLLTLIDGLVNDIEQTGFFAQGTNLTAWDSIAAHSSGLQVLAKIFSTMRTKTTTEPITMPYRQGILHGRDLDYANKIVAAKCWAALFAIGDWARAIAEGKKNPPAAEPEPSLTEILQKWKETQQYGERIESWKERARVVGVDVPATGCPEDYDETAPERTFAELMFYWIQRNYGKMAVLIMDSYQKPINMRAGEVRQDFGHIQPRSFSLLSIDDTAPAMTTITTLVTYTEKDEEKMTEISVHLMYVNAENIAILRGEPTGRWQIHQRSFNPIIVPQLTEPT